MTFWALQKTKTAEKNSVILSIMIKNFFCGLEGTRSIKIAVNIQYGLQDSWDSINIPSFKNTMNSYCCKIWKKNVSEFLSSDFKIFKIYNFNIIFIFYKKKSYLSNLNNYFAYVQMWQYLIWKKKFVFYNKCEKKN